MSIWTQSDLDTLKAAVVSGILTVEYSGPPTRRVTYQHLDAMRSLLATMQADIASASGRPSYTLLSTSKGF